MNAMYRVKRKKTGEIGIVLGIGYTISLPTYERPNGKVYNQFIVAVGAEIQEWKVVDCEFEGVMVQNPDYKETRHKPDRPEFN